MTHSPRDALLLPQLGGTLPEGAAPAGARLHPDLDGLHGAEGNVGKELCAGRSCQVQASAVEVGVFLWEGRGLVNGIKVPWDLVIAMT